MDCRCTDAAPQLRLTRALIEERTVGYHRTARGTRPDLRIVEIDGRRIAVKDFKRSDPLFRFIIGPFLIRREAGALRILNGLPGIPRFLGRIDHYALAMEHIDGTPGTAFRPDELTELFYADLRAVIDAMHAAGVAHCDLRAAGNVMQGDDGRPYLVDFAACMFRGRGINPFTRWAFGLFVQADNNAVLRLKKRYSAHWLTSEEIVQLETPLPLEKEARALSRGCRKIIKTVLTSH